MPPWRASHTHICELPLCFLLSTMEASYLLFQKYFSPQPLSLNKLWKNTKAKVQVCLLTLHTSLLGIQLYRARVCSSFWWAGCMVSSQTLGRGQFFSMSLAIKQNVSIGNNMHLFKGCSVLIGTRDASGKCVRIETLLGKGCLWKGLTGLFASWDNYFSDSRRVMDLL